MRKHGHTGQVPRQEEKGVQAWGGLQGDPSSGSQSGQITGSSVRYAAARENRMAKQDTTPLGPELGDPAAAAACSPQRGLPTRQGKAWASAV